MTRQAFRLTAASALALLAFAACSDGEAAVVKEKADPTADIVVETEETEAPGEVVEPVESEEAAPATAQVGDVVVVGDWDVEVTKVLLDAASVIKKTNQFNEKAKGQYLLVTYDATYKGDERMSDIWASLDWSFTTSDNKVHETASVVTPADNEMWPTEARKGGTVQGQAVFDIDPALVEGGLLTVEGYDAEFNEVFADFEM